MHSHIKPCVCVWVPKFGCGDGSVTGVRRALDVMTVSRLGRVFMLAKGSLTFPSLSVFARSFAAMTTVSVHRRLAAGRGLHTACEESQ